MDEVKTINGCLTNVYQHEGRTIYQINTDEAGLSKALFALMEEGFSEFTIKPLKDLGGGKRYSISTEE